MRRNVARSGSPYFMVLWGGVWFLGFLASHFVHEIYLGWIRLTLVSLGTISSAYLGYRFRSMVRSQIDIRFTYLWLAIMAYSAIWMWLVQPRTGAQASVLITSFIYVCLYRCWLVDRACSCVGGLDRDRLCHFGLRPHPRLLLPVHGISWRRNPYSERFLYPS